MDYIDHAGRVASYLCEVDGILGPKLTEAMLANLEGERPLTEEDAQRMVDSIRFHVEAKKDITNSINSE